MALRHICLVALLLWIGPAVASGQPLTVTANVQVGMSINRHAPLVLTLDRPIKPGEGRLAILFAETDLTALFTPVGLTRRYTPAMLPFPSGQHDLVVYLVGDDNAWTEIARWTVQVRHPGNFERADFDPNISLNNKGQVIEGQFPAPPEEPPHRIYQDFSGQLDGSLHLEQPGGWTVEAQSNIVGVSYQNEALRFGTLQEEAPRVDLSRYLVRVGREDASIYAGHIAHGRHPYLINGFNSRGLRAEASLGAQVDMAVSATSGTRVVGWRNLLGLDTPEHRLFSGTLGVEMLKERPGGLRVEASFLDGSVLPQSNFLQGAVVDAEKSRGGGLRVLSGSRSQRFRLEGGVAGSQFTNPDDPGLSQGTAMVPVETTTRFAHYLDVSVGLLQNVPLTPTLPFSLSAHARRERVDPLYRSVAAFVSADVLQHSLSVQAGVGAVQVQASLHRAEDNLDGIASILKTRTEQRNTSLSLPLAALLGVQGAATGLLPRLSYSHAQTHQFGVGLPRDGGFNASHVPDQLSTQHNVSGDWNGTWWRLGYRYGHAFQDNRQEGREDDDFLNVTHSLGIGLTPAPFMDVSLDLSMDRAENKADARIDRTQRVALRMGIRPIQTLHFSASVSPTLVQDDDLISRRTNNSVQVEGSWSFALGADAMKLARGQVFVRYVRRESRNQDFMFDLDQEQRTYSVNTGVSLTLF